MDNISKIKIPKDLVEGLKRDTKRLFIRHIRFNSVLSANGKIIVNEGVRDIRGRLQFGESGPSKLH